MVKGYLSWYLVSMLKCKGVHEMNNRAEQMNERLERRHLERKAVHLRRELRDWPMTAARRVAKTAELRALRVELLGSQA